MPPKKLMSSPHMNADLKVIIGDKGCVNVVDQAPANGMPPTQSSCLSQLNTPHPQSLSHAQDLALLEETRVCYSFVSLASEWAEGQQHGETTSPSSTGHTLSHMR